MIDNWEDLRTACLACQRCELAATRTQVVFGTGNPNARVMLVGEGPGENEDRKGEPFVGRGGQLLDKFLAAVDLDRHTNVYIANIVKCRPPKNRDPLPGEQEACIPWLRAQFSLLRPAIIVCLGRVASLRMIKPDLRITVEHGRFFEKNGVLFMPVLHPAALLRNPSQRGITLQDFIRLREKIDELGLDIAKKV